MDDSKIIDDLGGTAKAAVICEVSMAAVSQWRRNGIPKQQLRFLKLKRPDVFEKPPKSSATKRRRTP